jgi:molecular chaperone DnaJ
MIGAKEDYYKILGVSRDADDKEIKKAFRKLARKYHPDVRPSDKGAEQKFKRISEAYEILSDPGKRAKYDQFGHAAFEQGFEEARRAGSGFSGSGFDFSGSHRGFGDIFSDLFGMGREGTRIAQGEDLAAQISISLEDALFGTVRRVSIPKRTPCTACGGAGTTLGGHRRNCPQCRGTGKMHVSRGSMRMTQTCPSCGGSGYLPSACSACGGSGQSVKLEEISVKIPKGVDTGTKIRLTGKGEPGVRGGQPGDLYLTVTVEPHPYFERKNNDLISEIPITVAEAALGAKINVPTKDGMITMTIPPGTQGGQIFRLKGKGASSMKGGQVGDQLVRTKIFVPKNIGGREKQLFEELRELDADDPRRSIDFRGFIR